MKVNVDVDLNGVDDDIKNAIKDGVRSAAHDVGETGQDRAERNVKEAGAVWKGELLESFDYDVEKKGNRRVVTISNDADHAEVVEFGAEYDEKKPDFQNLLPWASEELADWQVGQKWIDLAREHLDMTDAQFESNKELFAKTFWLQQKIYHSGLDAVEYMQEMEDWLERNLSDEVEDNINTTLRLKL